MSVSEPTTKSSTLVARLVLTRTASLRGRNYGVLGVIVVLFVSLSASSNGFLTVTNQLNILDQWSAVGMIAAAATLVLISGGFDLSVAAVFSITGIIAAKLATSMGVPTALLIAILTGAGFGILNGLAVVVLRISSIIATLATGIIIGGIALYLTGGQLVLVEDPSFATFGGSTWFGVTSPSWYFLSAAVIIGFVLHRTIFGRFLYAVGGNSEAARLSGIRTGRVLIQTYCLSGLAAGFAGVMIASKQTTGQANAYPGLEFVVIAAVIVGGTSILGGSGAVWRTISGLYLLALIQNGANLLSIDQTLRDVIYGSIILGAAALDVWVRSRGNRSQ